MVDVFYILGLVFVAAFGLFAGRKFHKKQITEYREVLGIADGEIKELRSRVEQLLYEVGQRDVLIERSTQLLNSGTEKMTQIATVVQSVQQERDVLKSTVDFQKTQYERLLSQKKSSEVRTGMIAETLAPFQKDYPFPAETGRFLGQPVDMIHFLDDKVVVVEIKSGKSQLSTKQRQIRDQIKDGKVEFVVYRIDGEDDGSDKGPV